MTTLPDIPYAHLDQRAEQLRTDFALAQPRRERRHRTPRTPRTRLSWVRRALPVHRHA